MKHDPKSFLAGLSVGVSLRGWATAGNGGSDKGSLRIIPTTIARPPVTAARIYIPAIIPIAAARPPITAARVYIPKIVPTTYISPDEVS